jgi:hypothetical protein
VPRGFLPYIELQQMEAEGLDQPDQVQHFAVGHFGIAVADQGIADQVQIVQERPVAGCSRAAP